MAVFIINIVEEGAKMNKSWLLPVTILMAFSLAGCHQLNPLIKASCEGDTPAVSRLLGEGANINDVLNNYSPLSCATYNNKYEVVNILLEKGANPNNPKGLYVYTPLLYALYGGHYDIAKLLLEKGADPNNKDGYYAPLVYAIEGGKKLEIVKLMLEKGADPNRTDSSRSPLLQAVEVGNAEMVAELIKAGAKLDYAPVNGLTPLGQAAIKGNIDIVKQLIAAGANIETAINGLENYGNYYNRSKITAEVETGKDLLSSYANPSEAKIGQPEVIATPVPEQSKRSPVTNSDIVMMLKAKLPERTIIAVINQGLADFDTTPSSLIELRNKGATDGILDAVMQPHSLRGASTKNSPAGDYVGSNINKTDVISKQSLNQNELLPVEQNFSNSTGVNPELVGIEANGIETRVALTYGTFELGSIRASASAYIPIAGHFIGTTYAPLFIPGKTSESKAPAKFKRILLNGYSKKRLAQLGSIVVCVPEIDTGKRKLELKGGKIAEEYYKSVSDKVKLKQFPNGGWYFDIIKPLKPGNYLITFTNSFGQFGYWDFDVR